MTWMHEKKEIAKAIVECERQDGRSARRGNRWEQQQCTLDTKREWKACETEYCSMHSMYGFTEYSSILSRVQLYYLFPMEYRTYSTG